MSEQDPFALLLQEDDDDDEYEEEKDIACLNINNDECSIDLRIEDWLFADDDYTEKTRALLKFLKNDKDLTKNNKYKRFDLSIDLNEKELEIQENNPLYGLKYILDYSKEYITSLSIYITAYRTNRAAPFNEIPEALDTSILSNIFDIIQECINKYKLNNLTIQWIPINICNYEQITNGMIDILNCGGIKNPKQIPINILFSSEWLKNLANYNEKGLFDAIRDCKICKDLTLRFDKSNDWSPFNGDALRSMVEIFKQIGINPFIQSLSIFADNFEVANGVLFGVGDNDKDRDINIVNALSQCLENKTIQKLKSDNDKFEQKDFSLSLSFDANISDDFLYCKEEHLYEILNALYENENICLTNLFLYRNGAKWDSKTIGLICDLIESEDDRIIELVLEGDFVSKYSFGMLKVVGFDKLVNCLVTNNDDILELKYINIGNILDDDDADIYNGYIIKLIQDCNIWLNSITIKYEKFTSTFTEIIESFFKHLFIIWECLKCIKQQLSHIFNMEDVINLIVDFCKMESFEIYIVDNEDMGNTNDLRTERAEFRDCLYDFFGRINFQFTPTNSEKNRKEFQKFAQQISKNPIGIWRHSFPRPDSCVSVIL